MHSLKAGDAMQSSIPPEGEQPFALIRATQSQVHVLPLKGGVERLFWRDKLFIMYIFSQLKVGLKLVSSLHCAVQLPDPKGKWNFEGFSYINMKLWSGRLSSELFPITYNWVSKEM